MFFIIIFCQNYLPNSSIWSRAIYYNTYSYKTIKKHTNVRCNRCVSGTWRKYKSRGKWPEVSTWAQVSRPDWAQFNFIHYHDRPTSMYLTWDLGSYFENDILWAVFVVHGQNFYNIPRLSWVCTVINFCKLERLELRED